MSARWTTPALIIGLLALWELVGRLDLVAGGALPAPGEILAQAWTDRADYPPHVGATLWAAIAGFLIGNAVAVAAAVLFVLAPAAERLTRGVSITLFAIPPIALVPILVIAFTGSEPRVILAAVSVYFPTMVSTLLGLRDVDPRLVDLVHAYGGGRRKVLALVRLRAALPGLLAGLQVAAPAAVLGAILAEFGGGVRWGLGTYLLGSLGQANPARLWGIGLAATAIAGLAYAVFGLAGRRALERGRAATMAAGGSPDLLGKVGGGPLHRLGIALLSVAFALALWWGVLLLLDLSPVVAYAPPAVWEYLVAGAQSANARARLFAALADTLPLAVAGLAAGLAFAFLLAVVTTVWRPLGRALLPVALVSQTMPLVALTPLIVLLFGRTVTATLVVTVSVTFFPAFVTLAQGLAQVPRSALDVLAAYGASPLKQLRYVSVPAALPHLMAAARLGAPRALLGVMIAEWLATGYGIGNLINQSRGMLDYGMIWSVAVVAVLVSIGFYQLVAAAETRLLARR
ncbi:MAG: ABC transporter permease subunit [Alphaproteobacteria bacterium]